MNQPPANDTKTDSDTPFSVDPDRRLKMKLSTLRAIIVGVAVAVAAAVGYAVNLKLSVSQQGERSERIEVRINSLELHTREQTAAMYDARMNLRLMDQKLDYIARGRPGPPPAATVSAP